MEQEDNECDDMAIQNNTKDIIYDEIIHTLKKLYEDGMNFGSMKDQEQIKNEDKIALGWEQGHYVAKSNVDNYIYQPEAFSDLNLIKWTQTSVRKRRSKNAQLEFLEVLETAHEADIQPLEKDDNTLDILAHAFCPNILYTKHMLSLATPVDWQPSYQTLLEACCPVLTRGTENFIVVLCSLFSFLGEQARN